jgi:PIN domain nuclease of toxin-antitoxin system
MTIWHVVDTHALLWHLQGDARLGAQAKAVLNDPASTLVLPIIALAEACWIVEIGRTSIPSVSDLLAAVDADARVAIMPLDRATLDETLALSAISEMHDRQIVAAARLLQSQGNTVAVLTKDGNIIASQLVTVVW